MTAAKYGDKYGGGKMLLLLVLVSFLALAFIVREQKNIALGYSDNVVHYNNKSRPEGSGKASEIKVDAMDKTAAFECPSGMLPLDSTEPWECGTSPPPERKPETAATTRHLLEHSQE